MSLLKKIVKKISGGGRSNTSEIEILKQRGLKIGKNVDVFSEYPFDSLYPGLITIGDNVTISSNVKILAHDASMGYITDGACKIGIVEIGNNVFIGHGTIILCNTRIGDNVVIGAASVVTGDIPANSVCAGNPAKVIKTIGEFERQQKENIQTHIQYNRPWREWSTLDENEWEKIRRELKDSYGYIVRK